MIFLPLRDLGAASRSGPIGVDADGPGIAVVEQRVADLVAAQIEDVRRSFQNPASCRTLAELAHLAPEHAHRPMLDVEVVVLDVGKHRAGEAELAVEDGAARRRSSSSAYSDVIRSRSAAISAVGRSIVSPFSQPRDVIADDSRAECRGARSSTCRSE